MRIKIYDSKQLGNKMWYLGSGNLYEYLSHLRPDFFMYKIQRRLVSNRYLDGIYQTIEQGEPIPPLTLISTQPLNVDNGCADIDLQNIDILDGLQRTYRLWVIYKISLMCIQIEEKDHHSLLDKIKAEDPDLLELDFINLKFLKKMMEPKGKGLFIDDLISKMNAFETTFTIWAGLTEDEVVKKMLILNAGQKPVSATHQCELIFMRFFDAHELQIDTNKIKLYREKDDQFDRVKKGKRTEGEYLFSSMVISLLSYIYKKPMRVSIEKIIQWDNENYFASDEMLSFFNKQYLTKFVESVYETDCGVCKVKQSRTSLFPEEEMRSWFGKDTTMSGIFAALGEMNTEPSTFAKSIGGIDFKLNSFEQEYRSLSSVRINVGNEVRKAVYKYTKGQLSGKPISWAQAFGNNSGEYVKGEPLF